MVGTGVAVGTGVSVGGLMHPSSCWQLGTPTGLTEAVEGGAAVTVVGTVTVYCGVKYVMVGTAVGVLVRDFGTGVDVGTGVGCRSQASESARGFRRAGRSVCTEVSSTSWSALESLCRSG